MAPDARVALYYAPLPEDELTTLGNAWLGRDPVIGASVAQPKLSGMEEVTEEPRRYGFHATLKPPIQIAPGRTLLRTRSRGPGDGREYRSVRASEARGPRLAGIPGIARSDPLPRAASPG